MKYHILAVAIALSVAGVAKADELIIHTVSWHSDDNKDSTKQWTTVDQNGQTWLHTTRTEAYNNANFGVGYRWDNGWQVGAYYNSYRKPAVYVAKNWMFTENFGAFLGAATGYDQVAGHPVAPIGGLVYKIKLTDRYGLDILGTPPIGEMDGVLHLAITRKF